MKISLIIPTYNRPNYLKKCLESIENTYIENGSLIYIIDDASTNEETIDLINNFKKDGCIVKKIFKKSNKGAYDSMITSYEYCFSKYEYVVLIGSDVIVNNYFYDMMTYYYSLFPNNIISGFNTLTISEIGTPRHPIIYDGGFFKVKNTSGSACFGFNKFIYEKYFKETLIELNSTGKKCYDTNSTKKASNDGYHVICTVPSVVEHIGLNSSMGHNNNPDISVDYIQNLDLLETNREKKITINMATYPKRKSELEFIVNNLLNIEIISKIRVYLNEYDYVPDFLNNEKIEFVINGINLMDTGKFYWCDSYKNEYYFTMDDDLQIDEEYILKHIDLLNKYNNDVFVSLHGKVLKEKPSDFRDVLENYHCLKDVDDNNWINLPGTGVMLFDNLKFKIPKEWFPYNGMTDICIAVFCQKNRIPCIVRKHNINDIKLIYKGSETLWNRQLDLKKNQNRLLRSINKWVVYKKINDLK